MELRTVKRVESVKQHAVSLVGANEDLEGFGVGPLLFALNRHHDKRYLVDALEELIDEDVLMTNGKAVFLVESEDE